MTGSDTLRYDVWIEEALRGVIRRALSDTAEHGLDGDHHFYITFATTDDGVRIPGFLRAQYPEEMTIVLQHRFLDLEVDDEVFSVTLFFGGRETRLRVPLAAISAFADPSVNFGLQLKTVRGALNEAEPDRDDPYSGIDAPAPVLAGFGTAAGGGSLGSAEDEEDETGAAVPGGSAQVIALDAFRKK